MLDSGIKYYLVSYYLVSLTMANARGYNRIMHSPFFLHQMYPKEVDYILR